MNAFSHVKLTPAEIKAGRARQKAILSRLPVSGNPKAVSASGRAIPRRVSGQPVRARLQGFLSRAKDICNPANYEASKAFLEGCLSALDTEDHKKQMAALVTASLNGDREAKATLGMNIAVSVGHLIRAGGTWVQWYQSQTLQPDETPFIRNFVPQQVDVRVANADGTLTTKHAQPNQESTEQINLFFLLSDVFIATLFDPNKGSVAEAALGTIDISLDLMEKLDGLLQAPFIVGADGSPFVASFVNDGTPASHFHASDRINTANFPTGNIIAAAGNGATTKPRFAVIQAIDDYYSRFGSGFDPAGDVFGTTIHVASGIASQFGLEFTPTSGNNPLTNSLFANRSFIPYNGKTYTIVPDPTLDPNDKYVYVSSNQPAGLFFEKPAGALVHREERQRENEVETWERILVGMGFPMTWATRVLAVQFKS